jgi:mRNA interferase YafQ
LRLRRTGQFRKDVKKLLRQSKDMSVLRNVIERLSARQQLPPEYRDHKLVGQWLDCRECHLAGDWLLIYRSTEGVLTLERTGSHSELFG